MKHEFILILIVIALISTTGCENGSDKGKLIKYLEEEANYICLNNICELTETYDAGVIGKSIINFETGIFTYEVNNTEFSKKDEYNWRTNYSTNKYERSPMFLTASYNHDTVEFSCSNSLSYDALCSAAKTEILDVYNSFKNYIVNANVNISNL